MSTGGRRLVNRGRQHAESSSTPRSQHQNDAEPTSLPPYEPPSCPLSAHAQKAIDTLRVNQDYTKYKGHLRGAMVGITTAAADVNERLTISQTTVRKHAKFRQNKNIADDEKPERHIEQEKYTQGLESKVLDLTDKSEKAMRELVDYSDELAMQDTIMKEVSENIAAAPAPRPAARRRQRSPRSDGEDDEEEPQEENVASASDENNLSAVELLKKAKEEYMVTWSSKSMRDRYGDDNEYKNFKRNIHDAQHSNLENAPPVPHASTWFPEDNPGQSASSRRRRNNTTDNTNNDDDEDEIEMTGSTINLKCPLSLQTFREPWSNTKCNHTFEKAAFLSYFNDSAVVYPQPNERAGRGQQPKQTKCPMPGCDKMLELENFHIDQLILRRVQRAEKEAARVQDSDDEDEDTDPRGTQQNRPTQIGSSDNEAEEVKKTAMRIKKERQSRARSLGVTNPPEPGEDEVDAMDTD